MMKKICLNGLGRIGKLLLRELIKHNNLVDLIFINDSMGDAKTHAHLLEFDSIHGRWNKKINVEGNSLKIENKTIPFFSYNDPTDIPIKENNIDVVIDCTGSNKSPEKIKPYFTNGAKKVLVSAPIKDKSVINIVYGINEGLYDPSKYDIITAASCTTNSIAPIIYIIKKELGIKSAMVTTIHDITNTQVIADVARKDLRRSRSAINNLIPTSTGSASAITLIYPELKNKIDGIAIRVPVLNSSLSDCVFSLEKKTTVNEVNSLFRQYSESRLEGILQVEDRPLVSSDFINNPNSVIIDLPSTMVVDETLLKVFGWYDNEFAYALRMLDILKLIIKTI